MEFKQFWEKNKNRYFDLSRVSIELAINTACEDAWEKASQQNVGCEETNCKDRTA